MKSGPSYRTDRNLCQRILGNAKWCYTQAVQAKIEKKQIGSREFWKIINQIMNGNKAAVPIIINGPEVISSSLDKAKLIASIFALNSTLDDKGHPFSNIPCLTEHDLTNVLISVKEVSRLIKSLHPPKSHCHRQNSSDRP